jgi:sugar phosphate permease
LPSDRFAFFSGMCCMGGFFGAAIGQIGLNYMVEQVGWRQSIEIFTVFGLFITVAFIMFLGLKPKKSMCDSLNTKTTFKDMMKQFGQIMKKSNLWLAGVVSSLMFFPTSVFAALWGKTYIQAIHPDFTPAQASMTSAMIFIGWGLGSPLQGYISDRLNRRMPLLLIGSLFACLLAVLALYNPHLNFYTLCTVFVLFGMFSSSQILTFSVARDLCTASLAGTAIAFINTLAMVPGLVFQSGMGYILDLQRDGRVDAAGDPLYLADDYRNAFIIIPILLGIAFILNAIGYINEKKMKKGSSTVICGE